MSDLPVLIGSFADFRKLCRISRCYTGRHHPNKKALSLELRSLISGKNDFHDILASAFKLAKDSCHSVGEVFNPNDRNAELQRELSKGNGNWEKCAALHFFLLSMYPGHGMNLNQLIFSAHYLEGIFDFKIRKEFDNFDIIYHPSKEGKFRGLPIQGLFLFKHLSNAAQTSIKIKIAHDCFGFNGGAIFNRWINGRVSPPNRHLEIAAAFVFKNMKIESEYAKFMQDFVTSFRFLEAAMAGDLKANATSPPLAQKFLAEHAGVQSGGSPPRG